MRDHSKILIISFIILVFIPSSLYVYSNLIKMNSNPIVLDSRAINAASFNGDIIYEMIINKKSFSTGDVISLRVLLRNKGDKTYYIYTPSSWWVVNISFINVDRNEIVLSRILPDKIMLPVITKHEVKPHEVIEICNLTLVSGSDLLAGKYIIKVETKQYDKATDSLILIDLEGTITIK